MQGRRGDNTGGSLLSVYFSVTTLLHRPLRRAQPRACRAVNPHECQVKIAEGGAITEASNFSLISKLKFEIYKCCSCHLEVGFSPECSVFQRSRNNIKFGILQLCVLCVFVSGIISLYRRVWDCIKSKYYIVGAFHSES